MGRNQIENLGHSTFLVKAGGIEVLTDPFLTSSAGGIPRVVPPARVPEDLSPDVVLISHAHRDHLCVETIRRLRGDFVVVGFKGCGRILKGIEVVELCDFESTKVKGVRILKVPAVHNRGRDVMYPRTDVGGFVFDICGLTFYFAGDTSFSPSLYLEIRKHVPLIDFAMLPIGGFMPFFLRKFHQTPEEAVEAFRILKAGWMIPIHFGTWHVIPFYLRKERALERLLIRSYISGVREKVFVVNPGDSFDIRNVV